MLDGVHAYVRIIFCFFFRLAEVWSCQRRCNIRKKTGRVRILDELLNEENNILYIIVREIMLTRPSNSSTMTSIMKIRVSEFELFIRTKAKFLQ